MDFKKIGKQADKTKGVVEIMSCECIEVKTVSSTKNTNVGTCCTKIIRR